MNAYLLTPIIISKTTTFTCPSEVTIATPVSSQDDSMPSTLKGLLKSGKPDSCWYSSLYLRNSSCEPLGRPRPSSAPLLFARDWDVLRRFGRVNPHLLVNPCEYRVHNIINMIILSATKAFMLILQANIAGFCVQVFSCFCVLRSLSYESIGRMKVLHEFDWVYTVTEVYWKLNLDITYANIKDIDT